MSFPKDSTICIQEKAKRRRNSARGRKCAKGTIPLVYGIVQKAEEPRRETWYDRLRARIKALWEGIKAPG